MPVAAASAVPPAPSAEDEGPTLRPSNDKTADGSISLGQRVLWNGKVGSVRYIGDVRFAAGEWVGLELADGNGMHDGSVKGVSYFECPAAKGVFAQSAQLMEVTARAVGAATAADEAPATLPSKEATAEGSFSLGQEVMWKGNKGIVRYIGDVRFAAGEWVGLELTDAKGVHDGNVMGVPYFECTAAKGVFAKAAQLSASGAVPAPAPAASAAA